eukprot:gene23236-28121_t
MANANSVLDALSGRDLQKQCSSEDAKELLESVGFVPFVEVPALRIPREFTGEIMSRLRGHLLQRPRVQTVARVAGDDSDLEGATRLLLLREEYARGAEEDLPDAVAQVLSAERFKSKHGAALPAIQLLTHRLSMDYSKLQAEEVLRAILPEGIT